MGMIADVVIWTFVALGIVGAVLGASWLAVRGIPRRRHEADDEADETTWT